MGNENKLNRRKEEIQSIEKINILDYTKSNHILKRIFLNLAKNKYLEILKHNKKIQKRLNLNSNSYKEYSETYTSIIIKIKLDENKYGEFININNETNESYFHVYFNDNKEEVKRNYLNEGEKLKKIKITIDSQVKSFYALFENCI